MLNTKITTKIALRTNRLRLVVHALSPFSNRIEENANNGYKLL